MCDGYPGRLSRACTTMWATAPQVGRTRGRSRRTCAGAAASAARTGRRHLCRREGSPKARRLHGGRCHPRRHCVAGTLVDSLQGLRGLLRRPGRRGPGRCTGTALFEDACAVVCRHRPPHCRCATSFRVHIVLRHAPPRHAPLRPPTPVFSRLRSHLLSAHLQMPCTRPASLPSEPPPAAATCAPWRWHASAALEAPSRVERPEAIHAP